MMQCINWKTPTGENGFFLIEAIVAVLIMSIVLVSAIPAWILIQENLESTHQKAVSFIAVQNEMELFAQYLEETGLREVNVDRYTYYVQWTLNQQGQLEEGRLSISWVTVSGKKNETHYLRLRPIKDT